MLYFKKSKNEFIECEECKAEYALVPIEEYNGLKNALRIIRDRALQQIDKSKADEHGYKFLKADLRQFRRSEAYSWYITKQTPYSVKIPLTEVRSVIMKDLEEFYNYVHEKYVRNDGLELPFVAEDYSKGGFDYHECMKSKEYVLENSEKGRTLKKILDTHDGCIVFLLDRISVNHALGVYEIGYWATGEI